MIPPYRFPTRVATKADAQALLDDLFPPMLNALARVRETHPTVKLDYPFYWVEGLFSQRLREMFDWLMDRNTRVYKGAARWNLFYGCAERLAERLRENRDACNLYWDNQWRDQNHARHQAAQIMDGGLGI